MASEAVSQPLLFRTVDLNIGEARVLELSDGSTATVKLLDVLENRDSVRNALREARVNVDINGQTGSLVSGNYQLPVTIGGVQIDCTATQGLYRNGRGSLLDSWGLDKAARLRLWPAKSAWMPDSEFIYPLKQRWFATMTQMGNEPSFVDGGDAPTGKPIYYHNGLDIGGCEGLTEAVAATDGVVVSSGRIVLPGHQDTPVAARYDVVYVRDSRDWYYRYSHLKTIEVMVGDKVKKGQRIGLLGKEGATAWSHLHFEINSRQPSGRWGTEDGYAFLWEAYQKEHGPKIIAVARPHHLIWSGEKVTLDGSRSWSIIGPIERFEWKLTDGTTITGPQVIRTYDKPGQYSEILKVVDAQGNIAFDFAVVLVIDRQLTGRNSPTIHASYSPSFRIHVGDPVTFKVRSFASDPVGETWNFGDGSPPEQVRSDANAEPHALDGYAETVHRFAKPGHFIVKVEHVSKYASIATAHLAVFVEGAQ